MFLQADIMLALPSFRPLGDHDREGVALFVRSFNSFLPEVADSRLPAMTEELFRLCDPTVRFSLPLPISSKIAFNFAVDCRIRAISQWSKLKR